MRGIQRGADHASPTFKRILVDLEILPRLLPTKTSSTMNHNRCGTDIDVIFIRDPVISALVQNGSCTHNCGTRSTCTTRIRLICYTNFRNCRVQVNRSRTQRNQTTIDAFSRNAVHVPNVGHVVIPDRITSINADTVATIDANMADIAETLIGAFPENDIPRTRFGLAYRRAIPIVQALRIRPIRIDIRTTNVVINPVHKTRAVEAAITIKVFATPHVWQANVLLGIDQHIGKRSTAIIPRAACHTFRVRCRKLAFR